MAKETLKRPLLGLLLLLTINVDGQFVADSGLSMPPLSQRTQTLLAKAQDGGKTVIHFNAYANGPAALYQGHTECDQAVTSCTVQVGLGFSPAHQDLIIAHELGHVILVREGFPTFFSPLSIIRSPIVRDWDLKIGGRLTDCVQDPEDDRRLKSLGYPTYLQIRQQQKAMLEDAETYVSQPADSRQFIDWGVTAYCARVRGVDISKYLAIMSIKARQTVEVEDRLWKRFGKKTCNSPDACKVLVRELGEEVIPQYQGHPEIMFR